ncbi:MAG: TetR/AcrR family transcriptional regulator [Burkholderiales bacterium]|jgi:AcrR family transcriptional regulator
MRRDNNTDVRACILDAALDLLGDHGVSKLTQPNVAKAAGIRQSHLTYYFPTRADLLKATALHSIESMIGMLSHRALDGKLSPDLLAQIASDMVDDKRRARVVLGLVVASDEDREIKSFLRDFVDRIRAGIGRVIELLGQHADPQRIALFHTLVVGAAVLHLARDNAASRRESGAMVRFAVEQFLQDQPENGKKPVRET